MKISKEKFIEMSNNLYNNKYDYSKINYFNTSKKVCIICPEHGEFWKSPNNHLHGQGCQICSKHRISYTTEEFIKKAKAVHGDKYDYSKVNYVNNKTKVCINCPIHGEFWQTPINHLKGGNCPKCSGSQKKTTEEFIKEAKNVHGDKYDYSKVEYVNNSTKVSIICPIHGEFLMTPNAHVSARHNCPKCSHQSYKYTIEEITNKIKEKHPNIDVLNTEYNGKNNKGQFYCNCSNKDETKHGYFEKKFADVLRYGCPHCGRFFKLDKEMFIDRANKEHEGKYDYSKVEYVNYDTKVSIICPQHGEFWQTPHSHLSGVGCPLCSKENNINETLLFEFLKRNLNTEVNREQKFEWLGMKSLDIFIPQINVAIEYQGEQHFKPIKFYGGIKTYNGTVARDIEKYKLCKENNVKLYYFSKARNIPLDYIDKIYTNEEELLQAIKRYLL